ncbi:MAG: hypothetical protein FD544_000346 [Pelagibacterales bacterium]|nr:hypothetical protein [Pelagibacterales bacterium]|tara:strand:- start:198 stop:1265 length:1068 start_codon:yes stop_codon:yes gene_type:complete
MNKFYCIFYILLFILKTENVFSNNLIYDVNNVEIKGEKNNNFSNPKLIDAAFKKAFFIFINKTLLKEDAISLYNTKIEIIKDLVFTYQVVENKKNNLNKEIIIFNIKFDSKKINNFLAKKRISYADISNISLTVLPILTKEKKIFLYEENFFYKNWNKPNSLIKDTNNEFIKYNLALENIEDLEYLNKIKENLVLVDVNKISSFNEHKNYILIIIYSTESKLKAFIKTSINNINIDRNINLNFYRGDEDKSYKEAIIDIKKEIIQIWKEQNLIDVNTPSFLDFFLETKQTDDYLKLKSALDNIDIVDSYAVLEMTNSYSKIRLKYKGRISKIKNKLIDEKINVQINDNVWKLKIK